jgi:hypothetical protein
VRTNIERMRVAFRLVEGAEELNQFFTMMARYWNVLIDVTIERIRGTRVNFVGMKDWRTYLPAVQMALVALGRVINSVAWSDVGDVRANIVESQLAYVLRRMQHQLQEECGCGHGFAAGLKVGAPAEKVPASVA